MVCTPRRSSADRARAVRFAPSSGLSRPGTPSAGTTGMSLKIVRQASAICSIVSNRAVVSRASAAAKNSISRSAMLGSNAAGSSVTSASTARGFALSPQWGSAPVAISYSVTAAANRSAAASNRSRVSPRNGSR